MIKSKHTDLCEVYTYPPVQNLSPPRMRVFISGLDYKGEISTYVIDLSGDFTIGSFTADIRIL